MINRKNWKLTKAYLEYRQNVDLISPGSLVVERTHIRHILEWADETSFHKADKVRPSFPEYIISARIDGKKSRFSDMHIKKNLATARRFFIWMVENYPEYRMIRRVWISTIKPKKFEIKPKKSESVSLEEIIKMASAPVDNLVEKRIRAAAVFLFLSGIRIGAFVTLPIKAIDIEKRFILQHPDLGVKTKNGKYGDTNLLNIPDLIAVVKEWDEIVRAILPDDGYWFAPFSCDRGEIDLNAKKIGEHREALARKNLKAWLKKVGLPYHSPHKFRHGHIHYGLSNSRTVADYKAVSLNVMHASMDITDEIYSHLDEKEVQLRIEQLGEEKDNKENSNEDAFSLFKEFLEWHRAKSLPNIIES
jgi:site-specific recombinase XerC